MKVNKFVFLITIAFVSNGALALGSIGPPVAELDEGKWRLGYKYAASDMDLKPTKLKGNGVQIVDDVVVVGPTPWVDEMKIDDFQVDRHYLTIGYGLSSAWEVYAQLGVASGDADFYKKGVGEEGEWDSLDFDTDFSWGFGTRITLFEQDNIKWGLSAQVDWLDMTSKETEVGDPWVSKIKIDIDAHEFLVSFGPSVDMDGWKIYGGPFYYDLSGDFDRVHTSTFPDRTFRGVGSADIESDNNLGGFVGATFSVTKNMDLAAEGSVTSDGWGWGAALNWKF